MKMKTFVFACLSIGAISAMGAEKVSLSDIGIKAKGVSSGGESTVTESSLDLDSVRPSREPQPGVIHTTGLDSSESGVIVILLQSANRFQDKLSLSDLSVVDDSRRSLRSRNFMPNGVRDTCRQVLALDENAAPDERLAEQIAEELAATDAMESEHIKMVFQNLLDSVTPQAKGYLLAEKARLHHLAGSAVTDYSYLVEHFPDFLIKTRRNFCAEI